MQTLRGENEQRRTSARHAATALLIAAALQMVLTPARAQSNEPIVFDRAPTLEELDSIFRPQTESLSLEGKIIVNQPTPAPVPQVTDPTWKSPGTTSPVEPAAAAPAGTNAPQRPPSGTRQDAAPAASNSTSDNAGTDTRLANIIIRFALNSDRLLPDYLDRVDVIGTYLSRTPHLAMVIIGHTDSLGSEEHNRFLSLRRAMSVKDRLVTRHGIAPSRLYVDGVGEAQPLRGTDGTDPRNRRVAFRPIN